eukprot:gb/GEZN01006495.1/.p1 GENE.gb/GEZN01006495.1/~~gb/GEZN01006495.1/.p1  ORF type:complete len:522 (-),score=58.63 gb/GEZN01006495.1/:92-1537(-)
MLQTNMVDHAIYSAPHSNFTGLIRECQGPLLTSRAFALTALAMYDAYNSIERIGEAYYALLDFPNIQKANSDCAIAQAAHDTLLYLFPVQFMIFSMALDNALSRYPDTKSKEDGIRVGKEVARQLIELRRDDGSLDVQNPPYMETDAPGFHKEDVLNDNQGFYAPNGGNVKTFSIPSAVAFLPENRRVLDPANRPEFLKSREYTEAFKQLKELGKNDSNTRTEEQSKIGFFWMYDGRPFVGTPPRMYNQAARVIAKQQCNTVKENVLLFALLNLALVDAAITSWMTKYTSSFWRPVLGMRKADTDGNPETEADPSWTPLGSQATNPYPQEHIFSPAFPSYTSGHAGLGAAAFTMLKLFYQRDDIGFELVSDEFNGHTKGYDGSIRPAWPRYFNSFTQASQENAISRLYLGVHWIFDAVDGVALGDKIAHYVFKNALRPLDNGGGKGGKEGKEGKEGGEGGGGEGEFKFSMILCFFVGGWEV